MIRTPFAAVANINSKDCANDKDNEEGSETPPPAVDGFDFEDNAVQVMPTDKCTVEAEQGTTC